MALSKINSKMLSGSIADARIPASAVTQHVTGFDDANIRSDILKLAIHQAIDGNRVAYNLENAFVDGFEDDSGITTETTVDRDTTGEYVSSITGSAVDSNYVFVIQSDTTNNSQSFTDNSANNHAITYANQTKHSTDQEKIGNSSIYFDGSADQLRATNAHSDFAFGTGDFTIEMWLRWDAQASNKTLIGNRQGAVNDAWMFYISTSNNLAFSSGTAILLSSSSTIAATTWTHCAVVRDSGTLRIYKDGTQVGSASVGNNFSSTNVPRIAAGDTQGNGDFAGYMDGIRISKTCRYPSGTSFTPYTTNVGISANATGTLISDPQTASSSRTSCSGVIIYEDADGTATLGTDLKIFFTANNGTNWTEAASYGTATTYSGSKKLVKLGNTTVAAGSQIALKAEWANQVAGTATTNYSDSYSTGNRGSIITVTTNMNTARAVTKIVDGSKSGSSDGFYFTGSQTVTSSSYIRFQLSAARCFTGCRIWNDENNDSAGHGYWKWQGSNDGTNWTDLGSSFQLINTGIPSTPGYDTFDGGLGSNTTNYTYYQMAGVSGTADSNSNWMEWEFESGTASPGKETQLHGWAVNY